MELIKQELEYEFGRGKLVAYFDVRKAKKSYANDKNRKRQKHTSSQNVNMKNSIPSEMRGGTFKNVSSLINNTYIKSENSFPSVAQTSNKDRKHFTKKNETKNQHTRPDLSTCVVAQSRDKQHKENVQPIYHPTKYASSKSFRHVYPAAVSNETYSKFQPKHNVENGMCFRNEVKEPSSDSSEPAKDRETNRVPSNLASLPRTIETGCSSSLLKVVQTSPPMASAENKFSEVTSIIKKYSMEKENIPNILEGTGFDNLSVLYAQVMKKGTCDTEREKQAVPLHQSLKELQKYLRPVSKTPKLVRSIAVNTEKTNDHEKLHKSKDYKPESICRTHCDSSSNDNRSYYRLRVNCAENPSRNRLYSISEKDETCGPSDWNENPVADDIQDTNIFFGDTSKLSLSPSFLNDSHTLLHKHDSLDSIRSPNKISVFYPPIEFNFPGSNTREHADSLGASELYLTKVPKERSHTHNEGSDVEPLPKSSNIADKKKKKSIKSKMSAAFKQLLRRKSEDIVYDN